jgi:hypothetical protein
MQIPACIAIPPRITVKPASFEAVVGLVNKPRKPTKALRGLLSGKPVSDEF